MRRHALLLLPVAFLVFASRPAQGNSAPMLHEQITVDVHDDLAMGVTLAGGVPAALETRSGVVSAPDPGRPATPSDIAAQKAFEDQIADDRYVPDRDTRRPNTLPYTDPFTPSTTPFKRLAAFDAVNDRFELYGAHKDMHPLLVGGSALPSEDRFYADIPLSLKAGRHTLIPTVGPGARVLHAQLATGARELTYGLFADGADEWYVTTPQNGEARLVMEIAIPRATLGGELADRPWSELPPMPPVPDAVASAAREVTTKLGLGRQSSPRDNVRKMVAHFRSFVDSDTPLAPSRDVYTDLALSMKGVCRHRAYAFTVTALSLGIPTRMVINEAHAWVEVHDGEMWHRIDLGGAGRMSADQPQTAVPYAPPPDPFAWPAGATRGEDLANAHSPSSAGGNGGGGSGSTSSSPSASASSGATAATTSAPPSTAAATPNGTSTGRADDPRPGSVITLSVGQSEARRGAPIPVSGTVRAEGSACGAVTVGILLRDGAGHETRVGTLVTDDKGTFGGSIVIPSSVPLGDHRVVARTTGDGRCGEGVGP
jgi:hypothetical protein